MSALHIVQGGIENGDKTSLEKIVRRKRSICSWNVPKTAKVGDEVVIHIFGFGFFATAKVVSLPEPDEHRHNRYRGEITSIRLIEPAISLATIKRELPKLTWAKYPRSYTTPPASIAKRIRALIAHRRKTGLPRLDADSLEEANIDELRRVAILNARSVVAARTGKTLYRARSLAIRLYVLHRANGHCEGCWVLAPFQKTDGTPYLEPHHTTQLSDDGPDHPARVIGLCPNCHRRAHYSEDAKRFNDSLKRKLTRLEPKQRDLTMGTKRRRR